MKGDFPPHWVIPLPHFFSPFESTPPPLSALRAPPPPPPPRFLGSAASKDRARTDREDGDRHFFFHSPLLHIRTSFPLCHGA